VETPENSQTKGEYVETGDVGQKEKASLSLTQTRMLPHVTAETLENGQAKDENVETGDVDRKWASVA
jgi:hypothetical protein